MTTTVDQIVYSEYPVPGADEALRLDTMAPAGRGCAATSFKPFLHHITKSGGQRRRTIKLAAPQPQARVLTTAQAQAILDACDHLRDRFLFALPRLLRLGGLEH